MYTFVCWCITFSPRSYGQFRKNILMSQNEKLELMCAEIITLLCLVCLGKKYFMGKWFQIFLFFFFSYVLTNSWLWQILPLQEFSFVWLTVFQMYFSWFTFSDQTHSSIFLLSLCYKYALLCNFDLLGRFRILQIFLGITRKRRRCEGWRHWGKVCLRARVSTGNGTGLECGRGVQHSVCRPAFQNLSSRKGPEHQ